MVAMASTREASGRVSVGDGLVDGGETFSRSTVEERA
jgi:hypothetical protein